jgi:hypothetical protein
MSLSASKGKLPWLRLYTEILNDPKIERLSDRAFRVWVKLLCLARNNDGVIPPQDELNIHLRLRYDRVKPIITELLSAGLIDDIEGVLVPHNWDKYQYKSDTSTDRVSKHRDKMKRFMQRSSNVTVTAQIVDKELDISTPPLSPSRGKAKRPARECPDDWKPNEKHHALAKQRGVDCLANAEQFKSWHGAKGNQFANWDHAFTNWLQKAKPANGRENNSGPLNDPYYNRETGWATRADWKLRVYNFRVNKTWLEQYGPKPTDPGFKGPPDLLTGA